MENKSNNSIFFLTLSFICIWIVLDNILGKRYLDSFLSSVFPFYNASTVKKTTIENVSEGVKGVAPVVVNPTLGVHGVTGKVLEDYKKKQEEKQNKQNNKSDTGKMLM